MNLTAFIAYTKKVVQSKTATVISDKTTKPVTTQCLQILTTITSSSYGDIECLNGKWALESLALATFSSVPFNKLV